MGYKTVLIFVVMSIILGGCGNKKPGGEHQTRQSDEVLNLQDTEKMGARPWLASLPIKKQTLEIPDYQLPKTSQKCIPLDGVTLETSAGPYGDPRYIKWLEAFHSCDISRLLKLVEKDLVSDQPHTFAPMVWVSAKRVKGEFSKNWANGLSSDLVKALGALPDLMYYRNTRNPSEAASFLQTISASDLKDDPWALLNLSWLNGTIASNPEFDTNLLSLEFHPDMFVSWWPNQWDDLVQYKSLQSLISPSGSLHDSLGAKMLGQNHRHNSLGNNDHVEFAQKWLEAYPNDAYAHQYLASYYSSMEQYENALRHRRLANHYSPFHFSARNMAQSHIRHGQKTDALLAVNRNTLVRGYVDPMATEAVYIKALWKTGHVNEARVLLSKAVTMSPNSLSLSRLGYLMENSIKRHPQALEYARTAWEGELADWSDAETLMSALMKAGIPAEAEDILTQVKMRLGNSNPATIIKTSEAMEAAGAPESAEALLLSGLREFSGNAEIIKRLAAHYKARKMPRKSLKYQRNFLSKNIGSSSDYVSLFEGAASVGGVKTFEEAYVWLLKRNTNTNQIHIAALDQYSSEGKDEKVTTLIEKFITDYPDEFWPVYKKHNDLNTFAEIQNFIDDILAGFDNWSKGDQEWANRNIAFQSRRMLTKNLYKGDEDILAGAMTRLKATEAYGTYSSQLSAQMEVARAQNDADTLTSLWRTNMRWFPNDISTVFGMFSGLVEGQESSGEFFMAINHSLSLNRYDRSNLRNALNLHTQWGGSSIYATCIVRWTAEHYPEAYPAFKVWETKAMGKHGDYANFFAKYYSDNVSVGNSPRYVQWYQSAKRNALTKENFVDFDCGKGVVSTVDEDGMIKVLQEDFTLGKTILRANGPAWIKVNYTNKGKLKSIDNATGNGFALEYNPEDEISKMTFPDGRILRFSYNDNQKPTRIELEGRGALEVTYDEDGEIESTTGVPFDKTPNTTKQMDIDESEEQEESASSFKIALEVTTAFQDLLRLTRSVDKGGASLTSNTDEEFDTLMEGLLYTEDEFQETDRKLTRPEKIVQLLSLTRTNNYYSEDTMEAVDQITGTYVNGIMEKAKTDEFLDFSTELYSLYSEISPFGLTSERWGYWQRILTKVEAISHEKSAAKFLSTVRKQPLRPMRNNDWLAFLNLQNEGMWYRDKPSVFLPKIDRNNVQHHDIILRRNGDMVSASSAGLLIRRRGIWMRYVFLENTGNWTRDDAGELPASKLEITSLVETDNDLLLMGTNVGIFVFAEKYDQAKDRISTPKQGMPSSYVSDMIISGNTVYVATSKGATVFDVGSDGLQEGTPVGNASGKIDKIALVPAADENMDNPSLIIATDKGVFAIKGDTKQRVFRRSAIDVVYSQNDGRVLIMTENDILSSQQDKSGQFSIAIPLTNAASARISKRPHGFDKVRFDSNEFVVAKGDQGFAIWRDGYFEHIVLPHTDSFTGVSSISGSPDGHNNLLIGGENGSLYRYAADQARLLDSSSTYATKFDPVSKFLYVAQGNYLSVVDTDIASDGDLSMQIFDTIDAKFLDFDPQGRLIANDRNTIVRYDVGSDISTELFNVSPYCPSDNTCPPSRLTGLLAASDGSIWASAGPSVFRWKDGKTTEFNAFKDRDTFPINTHWVGGVTELEGGDILISAGNESHLSYRGWRFDGTNLIYSGGKFTPAANNSEIFSTSTRVGDSLILGSTGGFYEYADGKFENLYYSKDKTYDFLKEEHPNLFLGGSGVAVGDDVILFPSAAGVIAYQNGVWFYPKRLNWMLPDPHKAKLGSRHTYSVNVDQVGRIYVATDAGLSVLYEEGSDALDFLSQNDRPDLVYASAERRKLKQQARILIDNLDPNSPQAKAISAVTQVEKEVHGLQNILLQSEEMGGDLSLPSAQQANNSQGRDGKKQIDEINKTLRKRLVEKQREYVQMLAVLEREEPGLHQLLTVKPLELAALRRRLPDNTAVLQFIPQKNKLLLHLVAKDQHIIREVEINRDALMSSVYRANAFLKSQVKPIEAALLATDNLFEASAESALKELPLDTPLEDLRNLYDILLAPLETEMASYDNIYISTAGPLNYTPFTALTRRRGNTSQYAVERFTFSFVPTSYLLSLVLDDISQADDAVLVFGDPEGSLSGAKQEAKRVAKLTKSANKDVVVKIGHEASLENLENLGPQATLIHFATHGFLDSERPERSYLLMADNKRLSVVNIQLMDLANAELVFLSACETALGGRGIEYATLSRAFAHAGAPTTIASLWPVGDQATLELVDLFYTKYDSDSMEALANTQRAMLRSNGPLNHPAAWAAFQVYGRGRAH